MVETKTANDFGGTNTTATDWEQTNSRRTNSRRTNFGGDEGANDFGGDELTPAKPKMRYVNREDREEMKNDVVARAKGDGRSIDRDL